MVLGKSLSLSTLLSALAIRIEVEAYRIWWQALIIPTSLFLAIHFKRVQHSRFRVLTYTLSPPTPDIN